MSHDSARSGAKVWFTGSDMQRVEYIDAKAVHWARLTAFSGLRFGGAAFQAILSWLPALAWARVAGPALRKVRVAAAVRVAASAWAEDTATAAVTLVPAASSLSISRRRRRRPNGLSCMT